MSATLPAGLRIYAIGDIHGRLDLLQRLYAKIRSELDAARPQWSVEIFLGDYVDRGPQSRGVLEFLLSKPAADGRVCLMGNHEDMLIDALADPAGMENWIHNGGLATLASYDVAADHSAGSASLLRLRSVFLSVLPPSHRAFMERLLRMVTFGSYVFVHAGIRPGRALDAQDPADLVWIREPFLYSDADFGKIVVHGHTPAAEPEIRANRINIDTGAYFSGRLTCLVLEGETRRFLQGEAA